MTSVGTGPTVVAVSSRVTEFLERQVADGTVPGAVALIGKDGAEPVAVGAMSRGGRAMRGDAIVRIQSMTKAVTAVAALRLVEDGRLGLDDAVEQWVPELADRRVLVGPDAELDDTEPARGPITLRHLLTNRSGYGMITTDTPLRRAMIEDGTEAGADPPGVGAQQWLDALVELPLAFHPGKGWRYHHSFGLLGILLARLTGVTAAEHLRASLFGPLGMVDTGFWVPGEELARLPAAYRHDEGGLVETEPAGGGFYAGPPPFDVSHAELVSTASDYHCFLRALLDGRLLGREHLDQLRTDQVPASVKAADSFFPGFWDTAGWGYGVSVITQGAHCGRFGWSGGQGTDFVVDPDGTVGILLTQVELGERMMPVLQEFQELVGCD